MKTDDDVLERPTTKTGEPARTKVLTALEGFCDPQRPCIPGELLRTWHWCGRRDCTCGSEFAGAGSHGVAAAGRVTIMAVPRSAIVATLGTIIDPDEGGPVGARRAAERLLDAIAELEEGRLVRREDDVIVPFPATARISGPHTISYRPEERR